MARTELALTDLALEELQLGQHISVRVPLRRATVTGASEQWSTLKRRLPIEACHNSPNTLFTLGGAPALSGRTIQWISTGTNFIHLALRNLMYGPVQVGKSLRVLAAVNMGSDCVYLATSKNGPSAKPVWLTGDGRFVQAGGVESWITGSRSAMQQIEAYLGNH
ncbi:hypothetical protein L210DRAFT_113929 [Boletus edulis BED1]|uniref:Uncharacterized protein n=1 Tax=Boletus edulis BED1 TaxID=1328754 RepID=A0AAD4BPI2_BOLED|nr:hypothetical protein L210DRAFT_113929 [Boletus edulis BED1]